MRSGVGFNLAPGSFENSAPPEGHELAGMLFSNPVVNFADQGRATDTYNYRDNAIYHVGRHTMRLGFSAQQVRIQPYNNFGVRPRMTLGIGAQSNYQLPGLFFPGGISPGAIGTAQSLLATLAGIISSASQSFNIRDRSSGFVPGHGNYRQFRFDTFSGYVQDSLRVKPRLTLNLGVRWDYYGRLDERDGLMLLPVQSTGTLIDTLLSDAELDFSGSAAGRPMWGTDRNNFAPTSESLGTSSETARRPSGPATASTTSTTRRFSQPTTRRPRTAASKARPCCRIWTPS